MPRKTNVGLSRTISQDCNSHGFSLNLEGELPANTPGYPRTPPDTPGHPERPERPGRTGAGSVLQGG